MISACTCNHRSHSRFYVWVCGSDIGAREEVQMFLAIAGVLFLLWILGEVFTHGASLLIHILAIVWVISLIGGLFSGRKA